MLTALSGFFVIWVVVGVGWLLAHLKIMDDKAQAYLARAAFFAGLPCLLFNSMLNAKLSRVFSTNVIVSVLTIFCAAAGYLIVARIVWKPSPGRMVIGAFGASYVNANNMGVPITLAVLGDSSWVAPVLLVQVIFLQPLGLALLDVQRAKREGKQTSWLTYLVAPFQNPMTIAVLSGILCNILNLSIPAMVTDTVEIIGGLAVPAMLIAFGISLRLGPLPGSKDAGQTWFIAAMKTVIMPAIAVGLSLLFQLDKETILAVTVMAGLPCAQNVFVFAMRGKESLTLARDVIFITSFASIPMITAYTALLHVVLP